MNMHIDQTDMNGEKYHINPFRTEEERLAASLLTPQERQYLIKTILYPYPKFKQAQKFIQQFHRPVEGGVSDYGCIAGILGQSRAGKSAICQYYSQQFEPRLTDDGEIYPIVYIPSAAEMTPSSMAAHVFRMTGARSVPAINAPSLLQSALLRLKKAKTELVIIDDVQFLIFKRSKLHLASFLSFFKQLADLNTLNVLLVGNEDIYDFIRNVDFLVGRGGFPCERITAIGDDVEGKEDFRMLLEGIDKRLPFTVSSGFSAPKISDDFYRYSDGVVGRVMNIVRRAAYRALNEGTAKVLLEHLHAEALKELAPGTKNDFFLVR